MRRKKLLTTQRALAVKLGITEGYLSQIMTGKRVPSLKLAERIQAESNGELKVVKLIPKIRKLILGE